MAPPKPSRPPSPGQPSADGLHSPPTSSRTSPSSASAGTVASAVSSLASASASSTSSSPAPASSSSPLAAVAAASASASSPSSSLVARRVEKLDRSCAPATGPPAPPLRASAPPAPAASRRLSPRPAAAPPSPHSSSSSSSSSPPHTSLLVLSDDVLLLIFRHLIDAPSSTSSAAAADAARAQRSPRASPARRAGDGEPGYCAAEAVTAGGRGTRSQRALAATCRRLLRVYTRLHVRAVAVRRQVEWVSGAQVRWALARYAAADELRLRVPSYTWVDVAACVAAVGRGGPLRRLVVHGARVCGGGVRGVVAACPRLEVLELSCVAPAVGDAEIEVIVDSSMAAALKVLSLHRSGGRLTDAAAGRIGELKRLEVLDLGWCHRVRDAGFGALAQLARLQVLRVARTSLTDSAAAVMLPGLRHLRELDISFCDGLTAEVLKLLPERLEVLRCHGADVFHDAVAPAVFDRLACLREVDLASAMRLTKWTPLASVISRLEVLSVRWSPIVDDMGVAGEALARCVASVGGADRSPLCTRQGCGPAGVRLRKLDLSNCSGVGDAVLAAFAQCSSLEQLQIPRTGISREGAAALVAGPAGRSLKFVDVREPRGGEPVANQVREMLVDGLGERTVLLV